MALSCIILEIKRYRPIGQKSSFFHTPLYSTPPLGGSQSEYCYAVWHGKTRMAWLPDGEKIWWYVYSFWHNSRTWQTDTQTPRDGKGRACGKNRSFRQYLASSRVVNAATVRCYKQCRRTLASWWHSSLVAVSGRVVDRGRRTTTCLRQEVSTLHRRQQTAFNCTQW